METKARVVWINVISFLVVLLALPEIGALIPDNFARLVAAVSAAGNLFLRINTSTPLGREDK